MPIARGMVLLAVLLLCAVVPASVRAGDEPATGRFDAVVEVSSVQGTRSMSVTIEIVSPMTRQEAEGLREVLKTGGQEALAAVARRSARGKLMLGGVSFPLGIVAAERVDDGWRYLVVTARNFRWDEVQLEEASVNFPFAVADFEVPDMGSGSGSLVPKAELSVGEDGKVAVDRFEGEEGRLKNVRRR